MVVTKGRAVNEAQGHTTYRRLLQISPLSYLRHLTQTLYGRGIKTCEIASSHLVPVLPTQAISQNMKCHRQCWSKVPLIKGHSRFMILCDELTDHDHASTTTRSSSTAIFRKIFKPFSAPLCLRQAAIQHAVPRANNAHSIVAIIKPATA